MKRSQKIAISYAIQRKKEEKARTLLEELRKKGITISASKYAEVTIRRAEDALKEFNLKNNAKACNSRFKRKLM